MHRTETLLRATFSWFLIFVTPLSVPWVLIHFDAIASSTWTAFFFLWVATNIGVSLGYHRLCAHQSFVASTPLKIVLLLFGSIAMQGPPLAWAALHRQHHRHPDTALDPHSPRDGFWHAHCLWIFRNYHPKPLCYAKDLCRDRQVAWFTRYYAWICFSALFLIALLWGWEGFIVVGMLRLFLASQTVFFLNSISHMIGNQPHEHRDRAGNHWLTALLCFGEGWHNNHHAQPRAAFHGWRWYQFDPCGWILRGCATLGLAHSVVAPRQPLISERNTS